MPRMAMIRTLSALLGATLAALIGLPARAAAPRHFADAALHAVTFVGPDVGWAVGDDGAIWHTIDRGENWERQHSGVRASLRSVYFHDAFTGWAAGREDLPDGRGSAGVLLFTSDGGQEWRRLLVGALPGLHAVHFVDLKTGYLLAEGHPVAPSGVFVTHDSGDTWKPLPGPLAPAWLAGSFRPDGAVLAGAWNRLALVRKGRVSILEHSPLGGRNLRGVQLFEGGGVAVGDGGLVLLNKGTDPARWHFVRLGLPPGVQAGWDFHAVCRIGQHLWAVGRPGSVILHSPDLGKHWEMVRTGHPLPLHAVHFLDEKRGWAVGELGTILTTRDGGKTWQAQRKGGARAAVLCIHARPTGVPLGSVAWLGNEHGYHTAGLCLTSPDPRSASPDRAADAWRFASAFREAGGVSAEMLWTFPLGSHLARSPRDDLLRAWKPMHGGRVAEEMLRQLVLALRYWKPDVVVTDDPDPKDPLCALVAEAVREACKRAGDAETFPEQLRWMGLEAWKPTKLYCLSKTGRGAHATHELTRFGPRLGTTVREFIDGPQARLTHHSGPVPDRYAYRCLLGPEGAEGHRYLMQGLSLTPGGPARRKLEPLAELSKEAIKAVHKRENLRRLAWTPASELTDPTRVLALLAPTLADMPMDVAAPAAYAVASRYAETGQWGLAREAFLFLADRYPTHPLTLEAYRWLIRHHASSEARRRHELGQFCRVGEVRYGQPDEGVRPAEYLPGEKEGAEKKTTPGAYQLPEIPRLKKEDDQKVLVGGGGTHVWQWNRASLAVQPRLKAFGPLASQDPSVQFCLQAARRALGRTDEAKAWYRQFLARQPAGPWRRAAETELWLLGAGGSPPTSISRCVETATRPKLDGVFDDACWATGAWAKLKDAAGSTSETCPTEVRLAHDREFLYLAVRCRHPAGKQAAPVARREHDADLRGYDRVSLLLDLDRDYTTCCQLQIDQRGCVAEDCWGDKTWNPRWFVSVKSGPDGWAAEAAFPLSALTGDAVRSGQAWAANVIRVLPGRGVQAWSLPAEVPEEQLRTEGMGLLLFTRKGR